MTFSPIELSDKIVVFIQLYFNLSIQNKITCSIVVDQHKKNRNKQQLTNGNLIAHVNMIR